MNRIVPKLLLVTVLILFASIAVFLSEEDDAEDSKEYVPDGSVYSYQTYGSAHPDYYCIITGVETDSEILYVPTVLEGYDVRAIDAGAFSGCPSKAIIIPERVVKVNESFSGCPNLTDLYFLGDMPAMDIRDDVDIHHLSTKSGWTIGDSICIKELDGIQYGLFPDGWMVLGGDPSGDVLLIKSEVEGIDVASIGPYSFAGKMRDDGSVERRSDIAKAIIPEGITDIRDRAFYYCDIEQIDMPGTLKSIHDEAFRAAYELKDFVFPESVGFIGFESFRDCHSLKKVAIPDGMRYAGEGCFKLCTTLEEAEIGVGLKDISASMFFYDGELREVSIENTVESIGAEAFYNCRSLESISIPEGVSEIQDAVFRMCGLLSSLDLGQVRCIGNSAFRDCPSLVEFDLPSTVEAIDSYAFADCGDLQIHSPGRCPDMDDTVFLNDDVTVYCSKEAESDWSEHEGITVKVGSGGPDILLPAIIVVILVIILLALLVYRYRHVKER